MNTQSLERKMKLNKKLPKFKKNSSGHIDIKNFENEKSHKIKGKADKKKLKSFSEFATDDETSLSSNKHENKKLALQDDLSGMSFAELVCLKNKLGTKVFNSTAFKNNNGDEEGENDEDFMESNNMVKPTTAKGNKNRPLELSSKKKKKSHVVPHKQHMPRDPRFEEACGPLKRELFEQSYSFIKEIRLNERKKLQDQVLREEDADKKAQLQALLKRMKQQERSRSERVEVKEQRRKRMKEERQKVSQGKKPYFLKKAEQRKQEEEEKQGRLEQRGSLQKHLKRKEKKQLAKDRKWMSFL